MFKLPVEFNVPDVAEGEITVLAITFPALIFPV